MRQREFFRRGAGLKLAKSTWRDRTRESPIMREVEYCLSHFRFYVIPRDTRASHEKNYSIWLYADPTKFVGVAWRNNTGAARLGRSFVRFGVPGRPDFEGWLFGSGRHFGIEVKTSSGSSSPDQRAHLKLAQDTGVWGGIVRSYDETKALLESWGLPYSGQGKGLAA